MKIITVLEDTPGENGNPTDVTDYFKNIHPRTKLPSNRDVDWWAYNLGAFFTIDWEDN